MVASSAAVFWLGNRFGPDPGRSGEAGTPPAVPASREDVRREAGPVAAVTERLAREAASRALGGSRGVVARVDARGGFVGFRDREAGGAYIAWHVTDDGAGGSRVRTLGDAAPAGKDAPLPEDLPDLGHPLMAVPIGQGRDGVLAVFRVEGAPGEAAGRVDGAFRAAGWAGGAGGAQAAGGGADGPLLYTRDRRRCLAGVTPAADGPGCDVMILCDR